MIEFESVTKAFRTSGGGHVEAVAGVSFSVADGEFFTLLGPSGCGKTTTLRLLAGLESPDAGHIAIDGESVFSEGEHINIPTHRRPISMVFQSYAVWPHMNIAQNVSYPLRVEKVPRAKRRVLVERVLELVGLHGMGSRPSTQLSGGQQQRVALARALVGEPKVLLLDEPLSNLDARLRNQMCIELKALQSRLGVTTVYVTHDQAEALTMSDTICVMQGGNIAQRGDPVQIYRRPRNRFTAEFIGQTNVVVGYARVRVTKGINSFETAFGTLQGESVEDLPPTQEKVVMSIRPEAIEIDLVGESPLVSDRNFLTGVIDSLVFKGESSDCVVRVGDHSLKVKSLSMRPIPVGTEVSLLVHPKSCTVLVEEVDEGYQLSQVPTG